MSKYYRGFKAQYHIVLEREGPAVELVDKIVEICNRDWEGREQGNYRELELLAEKNPEILTKNIFLPGRSLIHWAAEAGKIDVVKLILGHDPEQLEKEDFIGNTAINYARNFKDNNFAMINYLEAKGADMTHLSHNEKTDKHAAALEAQREAAASKGATGFCVS